MAIPDERWYTVSATEFPHEQEAFDFIRRHARGVVGAWSNFEFIEPRGKVYEVDLMLLTVTDLFLIEIKSWSGVLDGSVNNMVRYTRGNPSPRPVKNPLRLANTKAKILRSMLSEQKALRNVQVPYIQPVLFFNNQNLELKIPPGQRNHIYLREELADALAPKPEDLQNPGKRMDKTRVRALDKGFKELGISAPRRRTLKVGEWVLQELLEDGELYQDHLATHQSLGETFRRVRTFAVPKESSAQDRAQATRAATREFKLTDSLHHPGILKAYNLVEHDLGPALIFPYDQKAERLDLYLQARDAQLGFEQRVSLIRQLADVLRYTHARRVYHRGLAPQSILVTTRPSGPELQVMDWQTGMEQDVTAGTSHIGQLMTRGAKAYLAPEAFLRPADAAGHLVDVFGWGAVAFHVLTGTPPAETQADLYEKLQAHPGLTMSAVTDGLAAELERLVEECTHPVPHKRPSDIQVVLDRLDQTPSPTTEEDQELSDPLEARAGDTLSGGYRVLRRLGKGATALALEVEVEGNIWVLKVPHSLEQEPLLEREAEALQALEHPHIAKFQDLVRIGNRRCILMQHAGSESLARRLAEKGPLPLEMLQRWGDDLLKALVHLEAKGIRHRDIKPANLGITQMGKDDAPHLMLFDFSLAGASDENIDAGTREYLDPFLQNRKPPRWDSSAERYSAGITLHEMATNILPVWGDGKVHPGLDSEAALGLEAERLDPSVRETLTAFFRRALARERDDRFANAEEMLKAWNEAFSQGLTSGHEGETDLKALGPVLEQAKLESTLASLGLEVRLVQAAERLDGNTIESFIRLSTGALHTASGVGNQTRKRLVELQSILAEFFEEDLLRKESLDGEPEGENQGLLEGFMVHVRDAGTDTDVETRDVYLGLGLSKEEMSWPTLARVCALRKIEPMKLARRVPEWRKAWVKLGSLKFLRDELVQFLEESAGVATADEVAVRLLARHGSFSNEPDRRTQLAAALARAAVEAEQTSHHPRMVWERLGSQPMIASSQDEILYLKQLAEVADRCAQQEPLLSPMRVAEEIRTVDGPPRVRAITPHRLLRLAAACSQGAAVSSREELYPRQMEAGRALLLAHGALLGQRRLTPDEIRSRVLSRYPQSTPLPPRPALDALLNHVDPDLYWSEEQECYLRRHVVLLSTGGSSPHHRFSTTSGTRADGFQPQAAEARRFEELLQGTLDNHEFLVLLVDPKRAQQAQEELTRRFKLACHDLNSLMLAAMRQKVQEKRGRWDKFLLADANTQGEGWLRLTTRLVPDAMAVVEDRLVQTQGPQLLVNPGLLARYGQLQLLEKLRDRAGARDGLASVWLLLPTEDPSRAPTIDGHPVPLIHGGQRAQVSEAWLANAHRTAKEKLGA